MSTPALQPAASIAVPPSGQLHPLLREHGPVLLAMAIIAVWVLVPAWLNPGQWGDNFEQFVWSHSLEWGYYKHPPLPTWLMGGAIQLFGHSRFWAYLLAGLCTSGTAFFTHRVALRLLGEHLAGVALLLWGLQQAFSARAQLYNHNTVLMLTVSATVWCVWNALGSARRAWWVGAGVGAAAAMLSKYQAVVPLAGVLFAMILTGDWRRREVRQGVSIAAATATVLFAPHVAWMVNHDFETLRYASQEGRPLDWLGRGLSIGSFLAQQVRLLFPALLLALLLWLMPGVRAANGSTGPVPAAEREARWRRAWFIGLVAFPLVITLLTSPAFGLRLQNHWGFQCLQYASLWLAWRLRHHAQRPVTVLVGAALALQAVSLVTIATPFAFKPHESYRRDDNFYPAARLAAAAVKDWNRLTPCPLKLVVGPPFEAGMISVYGEGYQKVLEWGDFRKTPWVSPEELERDGALYVADDPGHLPKDAAMIDSMAVHVQTWTPGGSDRVYWAVVLPKVCTPR